MTMTPLPAQAAPGAFAMLRRMVVVAVVAGLLGGAASVLFDTTATPAKASAGSEQTVTAADYSLSPVDDPMPGLSVTVSQTQDLVNQGVTVSWTGGATPSEVPSPGDGGKNFLQIFQCWGEDPNWPGHPDRTTCQYGGFGSAGSTRDGLLDRSYSIPPEDASFVYVPTRGTSNYGSIDFKASPNGPSSASDRVVSNLTRDGDGNVTEANQTIDVNQNKFFAAVDTNEARWVGMDASGAGRVTFEIRTVLNSAGLACGAPDLSRDDKAPQSCWLVILPRGRGDSGSNAINQSGLFWDSWKHHLAVKLDFRPVAQSCAIGASERSISGSELISQAVGSWQGQFCRQAGAAPLVMQSGADSDARAAAAGTDPSALALTSLPYGDTADDPLRYAPIGLTGAAIAFSVDYGFLQDPTRPAEVSALERAAATEVKLTPRLVAKLLTNSYMGTLPPGANLRYMGYDQARQQYTNPSYITDDPEFITLNCGTSDATALRNCVWYWVKINGAGLTDAMQPETRSDIAWSIWNYIYSDAQARAWLDGVPDEWGMRVNPWYSTSTTLHQSVDKDANGAGQGEGMAYPIDRFPKGDPISVPAQCAQQTCTSAGDNGAMNLIDMRPYISSYEVGAINTLRGDPLELGAWNIASVPPKWDRRVRAINGFHRVFALTTTGAAERYGVVTASLKNAAGQFVRATPESLAAAAAVMRPTNNARVVAYDPTSAAAASATGAYPLAMPVYAALNPAQTDAKLRGIYAKFIRFAVNTGQTPGDAEGELPRGYAPIPAAWKAQALEAAAAIESGAPSQPVVAEAVLDAAPAVDGAMAAENTDPVTGSGEVAALDSGATEEDPSIAPLAKAVPFGALTGLLAGAAVPAFSSLRRRRLI